MKAISKLALLVMLTFVLSLMILPTAGASADIRGGCNDTTATELGEAYDLNPFASITTEMSALCGEFLGPGTDILVARAIPATCGGYAGWAVFGHRVDGLWQLVFRQEDGQWDLQSVGNDLEETVKILGPREPRCGEARVTRSRTWHWDGQRFVHGPWTVRFDSDILAPSFVATWGRLGIICSMADNPRVSRLPGRDHHNGAWCLTSYAKKKRPFSQKADLLPNGKVRLCSKGGYACLGSFCGCSEDYPRLRTGARVVVGRFTCQVRKRNVKCTDQHGKGFVITKRKIRRLR